jgi:hypothetical protein
MSYSETLKTSGDGRYRVQLISDEYPSEPDDDGQSPLLRLEYRGDGWWAGHVMATGRPLDDDTAIEEAATRGGSDFRVLEKYLRAFYGMREMETWPSGDCWYVTYDTARWRAYIGFPEDAEARHLIDMSGYKAYCLGDVWLYKVERNVTWHRYDNPDTTMQTWETAEGCACGGFYGRECAEEAALEAFEAVVTEHAIATGKKGKS